MVHENFVNHDSLPGQLQGPEGFKQRALLLRTAFPDLKFTNDNIIAERDKVAHRVRFTGTHIVEFLRVLPTGKQITIISFDMLRWANGRVIKRWSIAEELGLMRQIGMMQEKG